MIPSGRTFVLLGVTGLLFAGAVAEPGLVWVGLALDLVILGLAWVDARRAPTVRVRRDAPPVLHQGEAAEVRLALEGPPGARVRLREVLPPGLGDPLGFERRLVGDDVLTYPVVPDRRGSAALPGPGVRVAGPWGLAWREVGSTTTTALKVYPRAHLEGDAGLYLREVLDRRAGATPLRTVGLSAEIRALREWRPGDELRRVHWKATARMHRPVVRETIYEQHQRVIVLLDAGRTMGTASGAWNKLDHALAATIAFARVVLSREDQALLVLFSREVRTVVTVDRHTASFQPVFEALHAEAADADEPDYQRVAGWCAGRVPRRSLAVVVTSVVDPASADRLARALAGLARRHRTVLVNLEDPSVAAAARSVPGDVEEAYVKVSAMRLEADRRALETRLGAAGVDVVTADASRLAMGMIRRYLEIKEGRGF